MRFYVHLMRWEILEKENKTYLEYINNTERAIVPYIDYVELYILLSCFNIIYICMVYFIVIPGKFVDVRF